MVGLQYCVSFGCTDSFSLQLLQDVGHSAQCYTVNPCCLSILYVVMCNLLIHTSNLPFLLPFLFGIHKFTFFICESVSTHIVLILLCLIYFIYSLNLVFLVSLNICQLCYMFREPIFVLLIFIYYFSIFNFIYFCPVYYFFLLLALSLVYISFSRVLKFKI